MNITILDVLVSISIIDCTTAFELTFRARRVSKKNKEDAEGDYRRAGEGKKKGMG